MIRLAVAGASGQTGSRVVELAARHPEFQLVAALTAESDPRLGQPAVADDPSLLLADDTDAQYDVLIDFSTPAGTVQWCGRCFKAGAAFVSGTTGLSDEQQLVLQLAADKVPVLRAANFSVGVNLLLRLVGPVARELGDDYDVEIVEAHHNRKVDAPSGTALSLGRTIADATGRSLESAATHGRSGRVGPAPPGPDRLPCPASGRRGRPTRNPLRHPGETIVLKHTSHSRDTFARGALVAAKWTTTQNPGLYSMQDVITSAR